MVNGEIRIMIISSFTGPSVLKSLTEIFFIKKVHNENIACYSFSFVDLI